MPETNNNALSSPSLWSQFISMFGAGAIADAEAKKAFGATVAGAGKALGQDVANVGKSLLDVASIPGEVRKGTFGPAGSPELADAARQFALTLGGSAAPVGAATMPGNALGIFGGVRG